MIATFTDYNSIYDGGLAFNGGAVYCQFCQTMIFTFATFINNVAEKGGAVANINFSGSSIL